MIILSQPTPFYLDRPIRHDGLRLSILEGIYKLEACGASFIAMPCNSAHLYFDELQTEARVPLLNIVEETLLRLPKASRVALFAICLDPLVVVRGLPQYWRVRLSSYLIDRRRFRNVWAAAITDPVFYKLRRTHRMSRKTTAS